MPNNFGIGTLVYCAALLCRDDRVALVRFLPTSRRHHERGSRCSAPLECCRRLSPASPIRAAKSNSRMRVAASSSTGFRAAPLPARGSATRGSRSDAGEARRVIRRADMRCPSVFKRYARWCDTIITESFAGAGLIPAPPGIEVRRVASTSISAAFSPVFSLSVSPSGR
jgi:hypothetical protein